MKLTKLYNEFFESEKSGGILLICCTALSLLLANSFLQASYLQLWHFQIGGHSSTHWINDGLMTIFFLLIGLELEREIYVGELSSFKNASLPIFAALGGMVVPAGLFLLFNFGTSTQSGAGIPMATDIAFAIGILSLLGNRVPASLKVLLTALAVIDDLGAIIVIAMFYTSSLAFTNLFLALGIFGLLLALNRLKVHNIIPYLFGGVAMWYFMQKSGIHPTITGVLLAFAIPFGDGGEKSPSYMLQHSLHKTVAFLILPLFALANTCITIESGWQAGLTQSNSIGIFAGLIVGKPLGIFLFSFISVSLGLCALPEDLKWKQIIGVGLLGGIGFTMSIFITLLAFDNPELITQTKIAILIASLVAGTFGYILLRMTLKAAHVDIMTTNIFNLRPAFQSKQEVIINAPLEKVWEFNQDLSKIAAYHPRVDKVELISGKQFRGEGVSYQCHITGGKHTCIEKDIEIIPFKKIVTVILSDTMGLTKLLPDYIVESNLSKIDATNTRIEIAHYYSSSTWKVKLLNFYIKRKVARDTQEMLNAMKNAIENEYPNHK